MPERAQPGLAASEPTARMRAVLVAQGEFELALARHLGLRPLDLHAMSHLAGTPMGPVELAGRLGIDLIQIEIALTREGVRCILGDVNPRLERHDEMAQQAVIDGIVELLENGRRGARPPLPPEALALADAPAEYSR